MMIDDTSERGWGGGCWTHWPGRKNSSDNFDQIHSHCMAYMFSRVKNCYEWMLTDWCHGMKPSIKLNQNQVENFLPYLTGKKQLTPRARDLTFCNWATNKVRLLIPQIFRLHKYLRLSSGLWIFSFWLSSRLAGALPVTGRWSPLVLG